LKSIEGLLRGKSLHEVRIEESLRNEAIISSNPGISQHNGCKKDDELMFASSLSSDLQDENRRILTQNLTTATYLLEATEENGGLRIPVIAGLAHLRRMRIKAVNLQDSRGRTPLFIAAALGIKELISGFLNYHADITIKTQSGLSPITVARKDSFSVMQRALVKWLSTNKCGNQNSKLKQKLPDLQGSIEAYSTLNDPKIVCDDALVEVKAFIAEKLAKFEQEPGGMDLKSKLEEIILEGSLSRQFIVEKLETVGVTLTSEMIDDIFSVLDPNNSGYIAADDFKSLFFLSESSIKNNFQFSCDEIVWTTIGDTLPSSLNRADKIEDTLVNLSDHLIHLQDHNWNYSKSPIAYAVSGGSVKLLKQLLVNGADPNHADLTGKTPLHLCAELSKTANCGCISQNHSSNNGAFNVEIIIEMIEVLIERGALLDSRTIGGRTPLHECFCINEKDCVSRGGTDGQKSAVMMVVRCFLRWGADPELLDRKGFSAIHYCCQENNLLSLAEFLRHFKSHPKKIIKMLTEKSGRNLLHIACFSGSIDCAKLLCRWDADNQEPFSLRSAPDKFGKFPALLLPPHIGRSALETLWEAAFVGQPTQIRAILNSDSSNCEEARWEFVEADDNIFLASPLSKSSKYGDLWAIPGVDSKSRSLLWSALHFCVYGWALLAASQGNKCAHRALAISKFKQNNFSSKKQHLAGSSHSGALSVLLFNNAFVDSIDHKCRTPLMLAAAANLKDAIVMLLDAGADLNASDIDGNTALHLAYSLGSTAAAILLESRGADQDRENMSKCTPIEMSGRGNSVIPLFNH
jgi:ankyrin repeat protein